MSHPISRVGFGLLPKHIHYKIAGLHPEIRTKGFFFFFKDTSKTMNSFQVNFRGTDMKL